MPTLLADLEREFSRHRRMADKAATSAGRVVRAHERP
jgi:hypothetical protein